MKLTLPYALIKDLYKKLSGYTADELTKQYKNYKFLKELGLNPLKDHPLAIYFNALYNFSCLKHDQEWGLILSERDVIEAFEAEYIRNGEVHPGYFREIIDLQLHTNRHIRSLKSVQAIDDEIYADFENEIENAKVQVLRTQPIWVQEMYYKTVYTKPEVESEDVSLKEIVQKYLHKSKIRVEAKGKQLNKFYIEVLGEKSELEITATETWEEMDFSDEETEEEVEGKSEPTSDKVINLAKNIPRLFLRGNPGTGKSTSLNKIYYESILASLSNAPQARIPILIEAKNYLKRGDIKKSIINAFGIDKDIFEDLMRYQDLLIMIDGLNEVRPQLIHDIRAEIKEVIENYPNAYYIITSRRYNFDNYKIEDSKYLELKIYDIRPLDEKDIRFYIAKHNEKTPEKGKKIWQQIKRKSNIRQLVSNPMYLRMILRVAMDVGKEGRLKSIPKSKGELYHRFMSKLLKWEEDQLNITNRSKKFPQYAKINYISYLAYHMIVERTIPEEKVVNILNDKIQNYEESTIFLDELRLNYLVEQEETGNLSFVHDTYSEYFAAVWLNKYFEVHNSLPIDIGQQQWFESIVMCSDIFKNPDLLEKYLNYLLIGGAKEPPVRLKAKLSESFGPNSFNNNLSVACSVAYNIQKKTSKKNRDKYFLKAERTLSNYLVMWLHCYRTNGEQIIPVENLFAAIGALSSRLIFKQVFGTLGWISIWAKLDFYPSFKTYESGSPTFFDAVDRDKLNLISISSINAFVNNLNDFTGFYFFLLQELPQYLRIEKMYNREYLFLKDKLLSDTAKSNIELMKYYFSNSNDFDVLKKIGERDIDFFLNNYSKLKVEEVEVSDYLRVHPLLDIGIRSKFDEIETLEKKIAFFQNIRISNDSNISDYLSMAQELVAIRNYEEAKKYFLKVINISPSNATSLFFLYKYYLNSKKYKEGLKIFRQVEKAGVDSSFINAGKGELYQRSKDNEAAIEQFLKYKEKIGENSYVIRRLASNYVEIGENDKAILELEKLKSHSTFHPKFYAFIGGVYKKMRNLEKAAESFESYLEYNNNVVIWGNLGDCYWHLEQYEKALDAFVNEYNLNQNNLLSVVRIADCCMKLKRFEKALSWIKKAEKLEDREGILALSAVSYYQGIGEIEKAIEYVEEHLSYNPSNPKVLIAISDVYRKNEDYEVAAIHLKKLIEIVPDDPIALRSLADCYRKLGKYKTAIAYLERSEVLDPDNLRLLGTLADCYKRTGDYSKALAYLMKILEKDSTNLISLRTVAEIYKKSNNYVKAAEYLEKATKLDPENFISVCSLTDCYRKLENFEKAIENINKELEIQPDNLFSWEKLADCYKSQGNTEKAIEIHSKRVEEESTNVRSIFYLADCYNNLEDYANAIKYLKKYLKVEPENVIVLNHLANCYRKLGQLQKAKEIVGKKRKLEDRTIKTNYKIIRRHLGKRIKKQDSKQDKINTILKSFLVVTQVHNILKTEGLNLSFVKGLMEEFMPDLNPIEFGQIKFGDFLKMLCEDTEFACFAGESNDFRLGLREVGIVGMEIKTDFPLIEIHSVEGYKKILEYQNPRYILPTQPALNSIIEGVIGLEIKDKTVDEIVDDYTGKYGDSYEPMEIRNVIVCLLNAGCIESYDTALPIISKRISVNSKYVQKSKKAIYTLKACVRQKIKSKLGAKLDVKIIDQLFE